LLGIVVFEAPFIDRQHPVADPFMRNEGKRITFCFREAIVTTGNIRKHEQTGHGFGGVNIGVEQGLPGGRAQYYGFLESFDPEFPENVFAGLSIAKKGA
jgi:hypothetical protein